MKKASDPTVDDDGSIEYDEIYGYSRESCNAGKRIDPETPPVGATPSDDIPLEVKSDKVLPTGGVSLS